MILAALASLVVMAASPPLLLDSPPATAADRPADRRPPEYVGISVDGKIWFKGAAVTPEQLVLALRSMPGGAEQRVYIRADVNAPYGVLFHLMEVLKQGGFWKIGLVDTNDYSGPP
jgi:biopolymer transport protein ExbD/biopolymer transport protein TolR